MGDEIDSLFEEDPERIFCCVIAEEVGREHTSCLGGIFKASN